MSSYRDAGVDIEAADRLVERIKPLAQRTRIAEVLDGLGGFAGLCAVPSGMREPVMVSGTDGVGTKLRMAFATERHNTIGIDLVAMCVNDVITTGARPLFFLDYFGTGKLEVGVATQVIEGISQGCELAGCALLGGETAELPGSYPEGEYDLAGFALGIVERDAILGASLTRVGDQLIALPSSGLHSNGYSLARRVLLGPEVSIDEPQRELDNRTLADELLIPTRIYADAVRVASSTGHVHAIAHVTGGGLDGNLPRVLADSVCAELDLSDVPVPAVFRMIQERGSVDEDEMRRTFNMGIGLVFVTSSEGAADVIAELRALGECPVLIGELVERKDDLRLRYLSRR